MNNEFPTVCWTRYDPESVIGEFGWLWQAGPEGFGWTLIATIEDNSDPNAAEAELATITLDDSHPPRRANRVAGLPYLPCLAPSISQGEVDRLEVIVRMADGSSAAHAFGPGDRTERIDAALKAILNFGTRNTAAIDVLAERRRQIEGEGWTREHDDGHNNRELAMAAVSYTLTAAGMDREGVRTDFFPFHPRWWKPTTARRDLVKAAALILAEIERLDREEARDG